MKVFLLIFALFFVFLISCEDDSSTGPDVNAAKVSVDSAKAALEDVMNDLLNNEISQPADINFEKPYNLFNQAYKQDPDNPDANFGLAIMNLLMITQSPELAEVFNEWQSLFISDAGFNKSSVAQSLFKTQASDLNLKLSNFVNGLINLPKAAADDLPKISNIQELIESIILPRLDFAATALDKVDDHPDYTFMVSPRMQGKIDADSLEIDLTEIYALESIINVLRAQANMTIAYNLDFWGFDSLQAISAFSKGGSVLKLRNGAAPMQTAKSALLAGIDKLQFGVLFLLSETDPQENDLIKINNDTPGNFGSAASQLFSIKSMLTQPAEYTDDWDNDPDTPDETITVNFSKIFDNPANDLKALIPDYSVLVQPVMAQNQSATFKVYIPLIIWNANSFSEWILPDPTFNGFLPGMTDSEFKRIFGIIADDWQKVPQ